MIKTVTGFLVGFAFVLGATSALNAQALQDDAVVAERGGVTLTFGEMRAKVRSAVPPEGRFNYFADGTRVSTLIDSLLAVSQAAALAKQEGLDKDPDFVAELNIQITEMLARRHLAKHMDALVEPDFEPIVRERYQANRKQFKKPVSRDTRHILILFDERTKEEAKSIADKAFAELTAGEDFEVVREKYTEDPAVSHAGWVRGVVKDLFDPAYVEATFKLREVGDISEPVLSSFGWHIIRFEAEHPEVVQSFDDVKEKLIADARREYRDNQRQLYIQAFTDKKLELNSEVMPLLKDQQP